MACPVRPEKKRCPGPDPGSAANGLNATNREKKHLGSIDVNNSKANREIQMIDVAEYLVKFFAELERLVPNLGTRHMISTAEDGRLEISYRGW